MTSIKEKSLGTFQLLGDVLLLPRASRPTSPSTQSIREVLPCSAQRACSAAFIAII